MEVALAIRCYQPESLRLAGGPAAVDQDGVAGDEGSGGAGEENGSSGDFHGLANAVKPGDSFNDIRAEDRVAESGIGAGSFNKSGSHGVDGDVVGAPFNGEAFGEMGDGGFAGAVDGLGGKRGESGLRTHVDDAAPILADHDFGGFLAGEKSSFEVDGERFVVVALGHFKSRGADAAAGVVDKNVELAEVLGGGLDGAGNLRQVRDIHLEPEDFATEEFDFVGEVGGGIFVAKAESDVSAGVGEG